MDLLGKIMGEDKPKKSPPSENRDAWKREPKMELKMELKREELYGEGSSKPLFSTPEGRVKREYPTSKSEDRDYAPPDSKRRYERADGGGGHADRGSFLPIAVENVQMNSWMLDISRMDEFINKHVFKVFLVFTNGKKVDIAEGVQAVSGDVNRQTRRRALCVLFNRWFEKNSSFFKTKDISIVAYDAAETFYVPARYVAQKIEDHESQMDEKDFTTEEWSTVSRLFRRDGTTFEITVNTTGRVVTRGSYALDDANRMELTRCIETVSNQILHTDQFLLYATGIYPLHGDTVSPTEATEIKNGFSKVSRVIVENGRMQAVMTVDTARSVFFKPTSCIKFFEEAYKDVKTPGRHGDGSRGGRGGGRGGGGRGGGGRGGFHRGGGGGGGGGRDYDRRDSYGDRRDSYGGRGGRHWDRRDDRRDNRYDDRRDNRYDDRHDNRYDDRRDDRREDRGRDRYEDDNRGNGNSSNGGVDYDVRAIEQLDEDNKRYPMEANFLEKVSAALKGMEAQPTHLSGTNSNRSILIAGLHVMSARTAVFERVKKDGSGHPILNDREEPEMESVSVAEYFKEVYNVKLKYPNLPVVISKRRKFMDFFPMEVLNIIPGQRIKAQKMTPMIQKFMTGQNSTLPKAHIENTRRILTDYLKLGKNASNTWFQAFGIQCEVMPIHVKAQILPAPYIAFAQTHPYIPNGREVKIKADNNQTFVRPAKIRSIMILNYADNFYEMKEFKDVLQQQFKGHNLRCDRIKWIDEKLSENDVKKTKQLMERAKEDNVTLVIGIASEKLPYIHDVLKYYEEVIGQQTLQLCAETVRKMSRGGGNKTTVDFVIRKLNAKCGGTNFHILVPEKLDHKLVCQNSKEMFKKLYKTTQFIGFELSHSGARTKYEQQYNKFEGEPTTVGVCYTMKYSTQVGGFAFYQDGRLHKLTKMKDHFEKCLQGYKDAADRLPETIVIYRVGSGEGDYDQVREEVQEMKTAASKFQQGYHPKFLVMLTQRNSHVRVFPEHVREGKAQEQNVRSGTCVDSVGSAHGLSEFILCCQSAMIGTVRPTRYTVIVDETDWTKNELMNITYQLAFGHQVSYAPPGIPNVLFGAKNLAKRGLNNYKTHTKLGNMHDAVKKAEEEYIDNRDKKEVQEAMADKYIDELSEFINRCTIRGRNFWA